MQRARPILVAVIVLSLSGCVLKGKPKVAAVSPVKPIATPPVAAAPPPPLSTPQTNVQLPAPQPVTADALATIQQPEEAPAPVLPPPPPPALSKPKPAQTPPPRTEAPAPPVVAPAEAPQLVRDAVPADEAKRLREEAAGFRRETVALLMKVTRPNGTQQIMKDNINTLVKQSEEAEGNGDFRKANELAQRALTLAKALQ